jgi:hypothetical protein
MKKIIFLINMFIPFMCTAQSAPRDNYISIAYYGETDFSLPPIVIHNDESSKKHESSRMYIDLYLNTKCYNGLTNYIERYSQHDTGFRHSLDFPFRVIVCNRDNKANHIVSSKKKVSDYFRNLNLLLMKNKCDNQIAGKISDYYNSYRARYGK